MSDTASHLSLYNKAMLENIFSNDPLNLPLGILKMRFKNKSKPSTVTQTCNPSTQNTKLRQEDWLLRVPRLVWAWFCLRQLKTNPDICCHINIFFKSYWNHHFALQCLYSTWSNHLWYLQRFCLGFVVSVLLAFPKSPNIIQRPGRQPRGGCSFPL